MAASAACLNGNLAYFAPEINHVSVVERETQCLGEATNTLVELLPRDSETNAAKTGG